MRARKGEKRKMLLEWIQTYYSDTTFTSNDLTDEFSKGENKTISKQMVWNTIREFVEDGIVEIVRKSSESKFCNRRIYRLVKDRGQEAGGKFSENEDKDKIEKLEEEVETSEHPPELDAVTIGNAVIKKILDLIQEAEDLKNKIKEINWQQTQVLAQKSEEQRQLKKEIANLKDEIILLKRRNDTLTNHLAHSSSKLPTKLVLPGRM